MVGEDLYSMNPAEIISSAMGVSQTTAVIIIAVIGVWSLIWKGIALWKSAKNTHKIWFIALLVFNTVGILEILYIFLFSKIKLDDRISGNNSKVKKKK